MFFQDLSLALKIYRMPHQLAQPALALLRHSTQIILDPRTTDIMPYETDIWLTAFARGVQYVHETYGCTMGRVGIFNSVTDDQGHENACLVMYDPDEDFAVITRGFIERQIKTTRGLGAIFGNASTGGRFEFTGSQLATMLGVEEAFHAYQFKVLGDRYSDHDKASGMQFVDATADNHQTRDAHYASNILETDAAIVTMQAAAITGASPICIGGGYPRGLYMRDFLDCTPQMNDIDIFADLPAEDFERVRAPLIASFGVPIRTHIGRFEDEEHKRGLVEFAIPEEYREACGGVQSLQINFGHAHPWADPRAYIEKANIGINQIAIDENGRVEATSRFLADMTNRTMTMNPDRDWTAHDWKRTVNGMERMQTERLEFKGWNIVTIPYDPAPTTGAFWADPAIRRSMPRI